MLSIFNIVAIAAVVDDNEIVPYYNNVVTVTTTVSISSSGVITIKNSYTGKSGSISRAVIKTYIEKKTLGLFWTRVDIGTTNDEWTFTSTNNSDKKTYTYQLSSTGTYRVTAEYTISGSGGSADEITKQVTRGQSASFTEAMIEYSSSLSCSPS